MDTEDRDDFYSSEHWFMWRHEYCGPIVSYAPIAWSTEYTWSSYCVLPQVL